MRSRSELLEDGSGRSRFPEGVLAPACDHCQLTHADSQVYNDRGRTSWTVIVLQPSSAYALLSRSFSCQCVKCNMDSRVLPISLERLVRCPVQSPNVDVVKHEPGTSICSPNSTVMDIILSLRQLPQTVISSSHGLNWGLETYPVF